MAKRATLYLSQTFHPSWPLYVGLRVGCEVMFVWTSSNPKWYAPRIWHQRLWLNLVGPASRGSMDSLARKFTEQPSTLLVTAGIDALRSGQKRYSFEYLRAKLNLWNVSGPLHKATTALQTNFEGSDTIYQQELPRQRPLYLMTWQSQAQTNHGVVMKSTCVSFEDNDKETM